MREVWLGDDRAAAPADPGLGSAVRVSFSAFETVMSAGLGGESGSTLLGLPISPRSSTFVTRLLPAVCALVLGFLSIEVSVATSNLARRSRGDSMHGPVCVEGIQSAPVRLARWEPCSHRRSHKRIILRPEPLRANDPSDDGTSRDPDDDDDTTNDLSVNNNSDEPFTAWFSKMDRYVIALRAVSAPVSLDLPSSPFPAFRQLRC